MNLPAIRIKCAEIVGFKMLAPSDWVWRSGPYDILPTAIREGYTKVIPNYPESADAALELVEWLEKQGWDVHVFFEGGNCSIELLSHSEIPIISSEAKTFPLVACLAFLKANNIDPETL